MCGIATLWGGSDREILDSILERQRHRGPDGRGIHVSRRGQAALGHRRLSIIDPEGGRQPIRLEGDGQALVANGMIYNYRRLRADLKGAPFRTQSDSETILHLLRRDGPAAVEKLDGMFAFVMADDERLIAARDPIGIKPLYVGSTGDAMCFASEIKALDGIAETVREFPPGHVFDSQAGLRRYYEVPEASADPMRVEDAVAELRTTLEAAVVKRLRSDVPLGCFLSGGLDSSIVTAIARAHLGELHTFAVGLQGSSDLYAARRVAKHLGTIHHELVLTPEQVRAALSDVLYHLESYDQDLVRSAVPCFFVSKLASERAKVILTGEGADELFAGYGYYADYQDMEALQSELRRSITAMHDINLQRVDRMSMAQGLEARVPFLDRDMIALGMRIPAEIKARDPETGRPVEKWILRKAFEHLLPHDIVWRDKEQFDEGSGLGGLLQREATRRELAVARGDLRSREEAHYCELLARRFDDEGTILGLVSRWESDTRIAV